MKKRKQKRLMRRLIIIPIIVIILILVIYVAWQHREIYKIESRVEQVKNTEVIKDSKFKTVAWLRVQGTNIDYPIIFCEDDKEDFPVQLESYAWLESAVPRFIDNIEITGHNIFNLSFNRKRHSKNFKRFEELMNFQYYDFAKENQYIQLTIEGKDYLYKIFAVSYIGSSDSTFLPKYIKVSDIDFKRMKNILKKSNIYEYDIDVNENDKFISLATCTRAFVNDRETTYYVHGRLLREGERATKYKVKKSKKYKEIEEMLEENGNEKDSM